VNTRTLKEGAMQADKYTIVLRKEESAGEEAWVARVPELPGCAATEDTAEAALSHIKLSINNYLELAKEEGRPIQPPSAEASGKFTVRVPKWVHRGLKLQADTDGVSLNQYVTSILSHWAGHRASSWVTATSAAAPDYHHVFPVYKAIGVGDEFEVGHKIKMGHGIEIGHRIEGSMIFSGTQEYFGSPDLDILLTHTGTEKSTGRRLLAVFTPPAKGVVRGAPAKEVVEEASTKEVVRGES
jgi:antitoxin HicB